MPAATTNASTHPRFAISIGNVRLLLRLRLTRPIAVRTATSSLVSAAGKTPSPIPSTGREATARRTAGMKSNASDAVFVLVGGGGGGEAAAPKGTMSCRLQGKSVHIYVYPSTCSPPLIQLATVRLWIDGLMDSGMDRRTDARAHEQKFSYFPL